MITGILFVGLALTFLLVCASRADKVALIPPP
jgi:hypothetical protein